MKTACSPQVRSHLPSARSLNFAPEPLPDISYTGPVTEDDFFTWSCLISGPGNLLLPPLSVACRPTADPPGPPPHEEDTPFEGGVFQAELKFPRDYPLNPPKVRRPNPTPRPDPTSEKSLSVLTPLV